MTYRKRSAGTDFDCPCCKKTQELIERHRKKAKQMELQDPDDDEEKEDILVKRRRLEAKRTRLKLNIAFSLVLIVLIGAALYFTLFRGSDDDDPFTSYVPTQDDPDVAGNEVLIPLSEITSDAKFYSYESGGVDIRYFAVRGSDGEIHVAFDACDVCYDAKLGYQQNGGNMRCTNCGKEFGIVSIGTDNVAGGCWPSYLPIRMDGENVKIYISDLVANRYMFE